MKKSDKPGVLILGLAVFALYLALASLLYYIKFASLPLGEVVNVTEVLLIVLGINLASLYRLQRRRNKTVKS